MYGNYRNKMIKSFVFADNIQGFLKWCSSIRRIKFEVTVNKVNKRYDMYYRPNFWGETKRMYLKTMKVIRHFNDTQQHYMLITDIKCTIGDADIFWTNIDYNLT